MSKLVIFDFDGTLADITHLHKQAWEYVLSDIGLKGRLRDYLPYEKYLLERFDSARRLEQYFLADKIDRETLEFFFETTDKDVIVNSLLDLKESHLLYFLASLTPTEMSKLYAKNIFLGLDHLLENNYRLGIISNTRESIIVSALRICKLDDCFSFILGEESTKDSDGKPLLKQDARVRDMIPPSLLSQAESMPSYVGDDIRIDSLLARNLGFRFVQVAKNVDVMTLRNWV